MAERSQTIHVAARVPIDLAHALERMAVSEERTVSQELRRAIRAHVTGPEKGNARRGPGATHNRPEQEAAGVGD